MDRDSDLDADQGVRIGRDQRVHRCEKAVHDAQKKQSTTNARTHKNDTETENISISGLPEDIEFSLKHKH